MNSKTSCLEAGEDTLRLCELFIVVRPEDKAGVSRVLEAELGEGYVSFPAVGRGCEGGLAYGAVRPLARWFNWLDRPLIMAFLPKIAFWAVVEAVQAQQLIDKVAAAVRLTGGPCQCAGGIAVISDILDEVPVGISPGKGTRPGAGTPKLAHLDQVTALV